MTSWGRIRIAGLVLAWAVCVALLSSVASHAWSTSKLSVVYWVNYPQDKFDNYDFTKNWSQCSSNCTPSQNVDWPVTIVFTNDAEKDKIFKALGWKWHIPCCPDLGFAFKGGTEHGRVNDGFGWRWDEDKGRKTAPGCLPVADTHYRLYADTDDRLYNLGLEYYVLATTHRDYEPCFGGHWFGKSQEAEQRVAARARKEWGKNRVHPDHIKCFNYEPYRVEYDNAKDEQHIWDNAGGGGPETYGKCTQISVPGDPRD